MAKNIYGVLLDVENKKVEAIEIADDLKKYYEVLNCTCIDIVQRRIGQKISRSSVMMKDFSARLQKFLQ